MLLGVSYKVVYDVGYFDARKLDDAKNAAQPLIVEKLTLEGAQQVVSGALKEDPNNPQTIVLKVIDDNYNLSTILIEKDKQQNIAWIVNSRLFFVTDILTHDGLNLTKGFELQYEINRGDH